MKKILALLCTAAMLISIAGCNGTTDAPVADDTATTTAAAENETETTTAADESAEKVEPWLCECGEVSDTAKCPSCGALSPDAQEAAEAEKQAGLYAGVKIPEDSEYVIENGVTDRMIALSTYIKGNQARLAKFVKKAQSGEKVTVAYLGGSITQGSSAGDNLCYAKLTTDWLMETFPDTEIEYVRAGIGATGSYIGVHRAERDVISKNPDLVFIDFTVNDTHANTTRDKESYEGLIKKLWESESAPAVVTIAMTQEDGTSFVEYHSDVCLTYDIPMISYREAILDVIDKGHIVWDDISDDNIHPNVPGHAVLTELITAYLQDVIDNVDSIDTENESDLSAANDKFANAALVTPENTTPITAENWKTDTAIFGNFGGRWVARSSDGTFDGVSPLKFEVEAKNIGVFYAKLTSMGGTFDVVVDGQVAKTIDSSFENGWGNYVEAEEVICFDETGKHTVEIVPHTGEKAMVSISAIAIS